MGGKVVSTGSGHSGFIDWDNGSVGVSNKTGIRSVSSGVGNWGGGGVNSSINSLGGKVVSTGSGNSWLINWDNSTVSVGNKSSIWVSVSSGVSSSIWVSSISVWKTSDHGVDDSSGSSKLSLSSSNGWLISWDNSSIGIRHQLSGGGSDAGSKNLKIEKNLIYSF